jgi:DNA-binding transcriptional ArsR family regulator
MARALADTWRFRILVEVTISPLSPSQFVERYGGDLSHISRCFRQLAGWGYIRIIEKRPGRRRGAAIEHVYTAVRRAHFDLAAWEAISLSDRHAVSYSILSSYLQRLDAALKQGTFDQEVDRHLSWDAIVLDRIAWTEINKRLDEVLGCLSVHELQASDRLSGGEGETIPTIVGLAAFRSPRAPSQMLQAPRRHEGPSSPTDAGSSFGIGTKLAKALSSEWRCKILMEVSIRPLSPSQFVEELGGSMSNVSRCFRELAEWGYVEVVEERKGGRRGGGVERIYRSTCRPFFDTPTWEKLPRPLREEISQFFLDSYLTLMSEAINAGTFDAEVDRHLSWKPLLLDRLAWLDIGDSLNQILAWLPGLEAESIERTEEDVDQMIPTVVSLACFRSSGP